MRESSTSRAASTSRSTARWASSACSGCATTRSGAAPASTGATPPSSSTRSVAATTPAWPWASGADRHGDALVASVRHGRAAPALPGPGDQGRDGGRDRGHRAGRGLGRRVDQDARGARRRSLGDQRQQDLHHERRHGRLAVPPRRHRPRCGLRRVLPDRRPTDSPGLSYQLLDKIGNWGSDTGLLFLENVRVPVANTIGDIGRGFQQQMMQFQDERLVACVSTTPAPSGCGKPRGATAKSASSSRSLSPRCR